MSDPSMTAEERTATDSGNGSGPIVLINSFTVPQPRDDAFHDIWLQTSSYFREQPGYRSLRLHRAITPDARYRWVNIAQWATEADYQAAHRTDEFRRLVSQEGWDEFPNMPSLYQVVEADG
jgi:heme oxygenase (mycobilin-producing)